MKHSKPFYCRGRNVVRYDQVSGFAGSLLRLRNIAKRAAFCCGLAVFQVPFAAFGAVTFSGTALVSGSSNSLGIETNQTCIFIANDKNASWSSFLNTLASLPVGAPLFSSSTYASAGTSNSYTFLTNGKPTALRSIPGNMTALNYSGEFGVGDEFALLVFSNSLSNVVAGDTVRVFRGGDWVMPVDGASINYSTNPVAGISVQQIRTPNFLVGQAVVGLVLTSSLRPAITSTNSYAGTVGAFFSNTVTATGSAPITFGASNLPAGLTISTNGVITGAPTMAGTNSATLTASNAFGVTNQSATFVIAKGTPVISNWPTASSIFFGQALSNSVLSGGAADVPGSFAWTEPTNVPPVGTNSYSVTFTPMATNNFSALSSTVLLVVGNAQNLVSNGGFESPSYPIGSHYHPSIGALGAWQTTDSQFEIWANPPLVAPAIEGTQHLEVDASVFQSIATVPNQLYKLSFWHSARPGFDNVLNVSVDSSILRTFQENGASSADFVWKKFTTFFVARGPQATIGFTNTHLTSAGNGSHIDDVRVEAVVDTDGDGLSDDYERGYDRYEVVDGAFTWEQAKADAEAKGGHLVTVTTPQEWEFLKVLLAAKPTFSFWLGGTDADQEGLWKWINGEIWNFTSWMLGQPDNSGGEPYIAVAVDANGNVSDWNDFGAPWRGHLLSYVVEFGYPTDPFKADTDGDGYSDSIESRFQSDPNNGAVTPTSSRPTGRVLAWGENNFGECDVPADLSGVVQLAAGASDSMCLKSDGSLVSWGKMLGQSLQHIPSYIPVGVGKVVQIASGFDYKVALKGDGTVAVWGWMWDGYGHVTAPSAPDLKNVVQVSAGASHYTVLKADGTVVSRGSNNWGELNVPSGLQNVVQVSAGAYHSAALKADGTVVVWGQANHAAVHQVPAGLNGVIRVAAGDHFTLALKSDGTVVVWGINQFGETILPAGLSGVTDISASLIAGHALALKADGTVVAWGNNSLGQCLVPPGLTGVFGLSAGGGHSLVLTSAPAGTPPAVTSTNAYAGTVGVAFSNVVTATGSTPITFGASNLPAGLSISSNGVVTGTPTTAGTNAATLTASNAFGVTSQSSTFVIAKGTPAISSWPTAALITYGQALSNSALIGGSANAAGAFVWNTPGTILNAGTNSAAVTFRPDSTNNYNTVSTNIAVVVLRAAPNVTIWPVASSITYGQALSNSVLSGGVAGVDGLFTFVSPSTTPPVGLSTHAVRFAPTDSTNYTVSTNTVTVTVNKASPVVTTLPTAGAVTEGQSLASSPLSGGSANVPGTFAWAEPGTVFSSPGIYTCPVIFTPNDTANYVPVTVQVSVTTLALPSYSLSLVSSAGGRVSASASGPYKQGTAVTLTPVPENGFVFVRWAGGATGSANPLTLTMTSNVSLQAIFSQAEPADSNTQEFVGGSRLGAGATASTAGGANAIAATPDGGTVSVGDFTGSLTILGQTYNAGVNNRGYVIKHNAQGAAQWIAVTGASGTTVKNERVAVDAAGNVLVAGTFTGTVNFGPASLTAKGNADIFVMKLSSAGVVQWVVSGGGTSAETLNGIFAGADGEVYVTGGFFGASATFGALPLAAAGTGSSNRDAFLGRVSAAGAWEWITAAGGSLADQGRAIAAAGTGVLWWAGNFQGSAAVGPNQLTSQGATDVFFAQVDAATGAITSSFRTGGTGEDAIMALLSDRAEGFYAAGSFSSSVSFGSIALSSSGVGDGYVARWQKSVQWTWAVPLQGGDDDLVTSLAMDAEGRLYAGGYFASESLAAGSSSVNNSSIFSYEGSVARFTSTGTVKWLRGIQGDNSEYVRGVACATSGALHAVGYTESALKADAVSLTAPAGLGDAFFLRMNPASTAPSRTVTVTSSRGGSVTLSPAGPSYPMGTQVTLTAVPEAGFGFTGWSGDASGTANPLTVTVNQSLTINANFADTGAPTIVVTSPVNGSQAAKATVNFAGRITDNTAVSSATWALNGVDKGNLSLAQDGSFTVSNVPLVLGDNIFTVTAADAVGNESVNETSVVWSPVRTFSLPTTATISEGRLLKIPLRLNSEGNVGGLQLRLTFDPAVFTAADFEFRGAAALGFTAKNSIEGRLDLATSLGGSAIPSGIQTIGELSVRARSVPLSGVTSPINVEVVSVSDNTGSILPDGTGTSGCAVAVRARSLPADINGNGFIDSGDGSVMMSLILSQDPVARPWDVTLNDLNNSGTLDPGDVTRLLRIVVGLDPKPSPFVVPRTLRAMSVMSAMSMSAAAAQQAESYYLHEQIGKVPVTVQIAGHLDSQTITADVVLPAMGTSLNSLQFDLVYPSDLLEVSEMTKGVVAPANALFNNATASARVIFAAADSSTWASAGGTVLRVTFTRKPGVSAGAARRLITLENLAAYTNRQGGSDPLDVFQRPGVLGRPMASVLTESVGAEPDPLADTDGDGMSNAAEFAAGTDPVNRASRFEVKGFAHNPVSRAQTITWRANRGVRYRMQSSEDLSNWSAVSGTELIGDDTDVTLQVTPVGTKTKLFYRLQVAP